MKIFSIITFAALVTFSFSACNTEQIGPIYSDSGKASFTASRLPAVNLQSANPTFKVTVYRTVTTGAASYKVSAVGSAASRFVVPGQVDFADGKGISEITIQADQSMLPGEVYPLQLKIDDADASVGAVQVTNINVSLAYTFQPLGTGKYKSNFFEEDFDVVIEKDKDVLAYKLIAPFAAGYDIVFQLTDDGQKLKRFDDQETGFKHPSYGMISFAAQGMTREGNTLMFTISPYVSAGTFASSLEEVTLP